MKDIAIFGAGQIAIAAKKLLADEGYNSILYDANTYTESVFDNHDVFLCATPWFATKYIAENVAKREGKLYFDLTEDVEIGKTIRQGSKSVMIPHCGLAPGAVSIIAASMMPAHRIEIAVGAIPVNPVGRLRYHLTWSTDGLVNEYLKPCPAICNGKLVQLSPMEDRRFWYDESADYESFNTSGGIGTFAETALGKIHELRYQTIRYIGHCDYMNFLFEDLGFKNNQKSLVDLLNANLPRGGEDKVIIKIIADGTKYNKDIRGRDGLSAIQLTTAAGVVAVMIWAIRKNLTKIAGQFNLRPGNWIANEDIPRAELQNIKCWASVYE